MKTKFLKLLSLLAVVSLCASQPQELPSGLYQEIIADADTLADSVKIFSKISQTSKQLKQQLNQALTSLVDKLAEKYGIEKALVAFYLDENYAKNRMLSGARLSFNLFDELLSFEKDPKALSLVSQRLAKAGIKICPGEKLRESTQNQFLNNLWEQVQNLPLKQWWTYSGMIDPNRFTEEGVFYWINRADVNYSLSHYGVLKKPDGGDYVIWIDAPNAKTNQYQAVVVEMDSQTLALNGESARAFGFDFAAKDWSLCKFIQLKNDQGYAAIFDNIKNPTIVRIIRVPSNQQEYPTIIDLNVGKSKQTFDWGL